MRSARQDGLGGAAGASLALHLGAGLWLALGGAVPGGSPAREMAMEVAFLPHAAAGAVVSPEPEAALEEEIASPIDAPQLSEPGPLTAPLPVPPPLAESPPQPSEAPQLAARPEPSAAPSAMTESLSPEPLPIAAAPEPMAELPPRAKSPTPAPEPIPAAATPEPVPPPLAEPRRVEAPPKPPATPRRPVQPAAARSAAREAAGQAMQGAAAIPVAAAAITPGPPPLITQARYRHPPTPPAYPPRAIAFRMAGTAFIRALVGPDGQTRELRLHRSSGFAELDQAAMAAVRGWAFAAATEGGRPIEAWVEVPVRFRLDD